MILLKILIFIFGTLIGSFLNVVIYRVPRNLSVISPRSRCSSCNHQLTWYENIPLLSYIIQKGKCRKCKAGFSIRYPAVELLCGLFALLLIPISFELPIIINSLLLFFIASCFLAHFLIDIEFQLLPDKINIFLFLFSSIYAFMNYELIYWISGGVLGFVSTYFITWSFWKLRGVVGLGGGDIKLFGILGILLGLHGILANIFTSCAIGAIVGSILIGLKKLDKDKPFAFGPFILITASIQIYFPELFNLINVLNLALH